MLVLFLKQSVHGNSIKNNLPIFNMRFTVHLKLLFFFNRSQRCTHTFLNLVPDCLYDSGAVALTQLLRGPQVVTGRLHLLLLKCHHGVLQRKAVNTSSK